MSTRLKWDRQLVAATMEMQGCIFATIDGREMFISHDEEVTGLYAWPEHKEGENPDFEAFFGEDGDDETFDAIAEYINAGAAA